MSEGREQIEFKIPGNRPEYVADPLFNAVEAERAMRFHKQIPGYKITPLTSLQNYAKWVGLKDVSVKDESYRFGLNAFKVLGGSYAVGKLLCRQLGLFIRDTRFTTLVSDETREKLGDITFTSTTDGNHGRGIAWAANQLRQKCVINMPRGSADSRVKNIEALGATVTVQDLNYDECVRYTDRQAKENGWVVVQDTAWDGYTEIPGWIMQGYLTMAKEVVDQYDSRGTKPTHVFLQAGVGAMAAAIAVFLKDYYKEECPKIICVEPQAADCVFQSAIKNKDKPVAVTGNLNSIAAGLCCGEVNPLSWHTLRTLPALYVSVQDKYAANGMRILGNPLQGDTVVYSGESGSIGMGVLDYICNEADAKNIREYLELDGNSSVLIFSTEGVTDPVMYRKVVWHGAFPDDSLGKNITDKFLLEYLLS